MTPSSLKLLLVDDDLDYADYIGASLVGTDTLAIHVDHVADFEGAQKIVAANCHDAYLIDHELGPVSKTGLELIEFGRNVSLKPMIMLSSNVDEKTSDLALSLGASDFLNKQHATIPVIERVVRNSIQRIDSIANMAKENAALTQQLHQDQLTGVCSRIAIERQLDQALLRCKSDQVGVLMYFDLDNFKPVNDYYGHAAGDQVLKIVARRISDALRTTDYFGRIGGDEFLLVGQPDDTDIFANGDIDILIHRVCESVIRPMQFYDVAGDLVETKVSASVGVVRYTETDKNKDYLIALADKAMYVNKARHKTTVQ